MVERPLLGDPSQVTADAEELPAIERVEVAKPPLLRNLLRLWQRGAGPVEFAACEDVGRLGPRPDRRLHRRIPTALAATYRSPSTVVDGIVVNLSLGGVYMLAAEFDPIGTAGHVAMTIDRDRSIGVTGRVAWHGAESFGFRFDQPEAAVRLELANYLLLLQHGSQTR